MFIRLLVTFFLLCVTVQSAVTSSSKSPSPNAAILPKQAASFDQLELNDGTATVEGSGEGANLDEYADDDENEQLAKVTATTMSSSTSTTTTTKLPPKKTTNVTKSSDLDANEFDEDYKDDLEDNVDYNEVTTKTSNVSPSSTRPSHAAQPPKTSMRVFFGFLTRPPIAAGILAGSYLLSQGSLLTRSISVLGLAIGILTSVILLICLVQRFNKRQRNHSSYTTGLLYPNHYGYSKTPQEFYA